MNKTPRSIGVIGGGTAGFISALILKKRFPDIDITMVKSEKIGIIGVGEGSTEHWKTFLNFIGIDFKEMIKECDSTLKCGIMFKDWGKIDYLHCIQDEYNHKIGMYSYVYANLIGKNCHPSELNSKLFWRSEVNRWHLDNLDVSPTFQFHFNTHRLNQWLTFQAEHLGIKIIDDEILDLEISEKNEITQLFGQKRKYNFDFYIDSTGFKKILISKLGAKWTSYSKYLKMKSAIVFPTGDEENYNVFTLAQAMDFGWMFKIPVWGRHGNGYIFDSDYISPDQAKEEVEKFLGKQIDVAKTLTFDPGALDRTWIGNCVAIGLSSSFVEPLEASSIGTSIQQSFMLMYKLINYDQKCIDKYNKNCNNLLENIRDFIVLHYMTKKDSSVFWKDVQRLEIPDSLASKLDLWKYRLPISDDFNQDTRYTLFTEDHHLMILHGLGLFDTEKIKKEFEMCNISIKIESDNILRRVKLNEDTVARISHKQYLSEIRNV